MEIKRNLLFLALSALLAACSTDTAPPTPEPDASPPPTPITASAEIPTPAFSSDPFTDGIVARRNGDYARAVAAFQIVLNSNPAPDLASESQYRLAEAYWLKDDYPNAIQTFSAFLGANPKGAHAPETNYFLADSYRATKDYSNAVASYRVYRDQSPTLAGDVDATIADTMITMGDATNAIAQFDKALDDKLLATSTRILILQRAADVFQGQGKPALAGARYDAAYQLTTDAKTRADLLLKAGEAFAAAGQLDQAVQRWIDAINKYPEQASAYQALVDLINRSIVVDDYQRGLVDYYAGQYDAAVAAFQRELSSDSARAADIHYYVALSYARKNAYTQAISEYDTILKSFPKSNRFTEAYLNKAGAQGAIGNIDDAIVTYKRFATNYPDDASADDALFRAAQLLDKVKRYDEAADLYAQTQAKFSTRERASEALFLAGFDDYRAKDFKSAATRWELLLKTYPQSSHLARTLVWLGKTAQSRGQNEAAKTYWTQAANTTPAAKTYWSWRGAELLNNNRNKMDPRRYDETRYSMDSANDRADFEKWLSGWAKNPPSTGLGVIDASTRDDLRFRRGSELLKLDRTPEARVEFASLLASKQDDPYALYALALFSREHNLFSLAMSAAERIAKIAPTGDVPRWLWIMRYPLYYSDLVVAESKANQLDPLLYLAVIKWESGFNTWATADAGERGLGQIIPPTAKGIAQSLGVKNYDPDTLFLPFVNVRFGAWFFAQNLKQFDDPIYALSAYNAGGGRAKNWVKPDIDLAVEEIDIASTNFYARAIYAYWKQYQDIYR